MKKEPLIVIKLMIRNYTDQLSQEILGQAKALLFQKYPKIEIELLNTEKYWKIPELTICYVGIYYENAISITDVLSCLTKSNFWHEKDKLEEESVWDLRIHQGILINKNVEWAHVYTW